jgi:hypothetical protein
MSSLIFNHLVFTNSSLNLFVSERYANSEMDFVFIRFYLHNRKCEVDVTTYESCVGRGIGQAVSRRISNIAARFNPWSSGILRGHNITGACFLRVFQFSLSISIPPTAPQSLIILSSHSL